MRNMTIRKVEDIGELIKKERKRAALKQADCAALCGVGVRFLSELENGKSTLEIDKVLRVVKLLGFEIKMEHK